MTQISRGILCLCPSYIIIMFTTILISAFVFASRIVQSLYFLNLKFQASIVYRSIFCGLTARFVSDLVENPEDQSSHNDAQINKPVCSCRKLCLPLAKDLLSKLLKALISLIEVAESLCIHTLCKENKP